MTKDGMMEYYYVHRDDLRKWQLSTLQIQQDVQKLLVNHNIQCWCGGGTLIGAIRERGFLYWDNDLDMFFMFKDYKKIIKIFLDKKIFDSNSFYQFRNGYWQENSNFAKLVSSDKIDNVLLNFEIEKLSSEMFKLFSKTSINIRLYEKNFNKPDRYVKIMRRSKVHLTRHRLVHRNDNIVDGETYAVMPDICMLPMIEIKYTEYLNFLHRYSFSRALTHLAEFAKYKESRLNNICQPLSAQENEVCTGLNPRPTEKFSHKTKIMLQTLVSAYIYWFTVIKHKFIKSYSGKFISYKPVDFRFIVHPFPVEDIFPLRKITFENVEIFVPNKAHEILKTQFGDYTKVPEVENRIAYPFFFEDRMH